MNTVEELSMRLMSIDQLCQWMEQSVSEIGETVWDPIIFVKGMLVPLRYQWTSQLTREEPWLRLCGFDENSKWMVHEHDCTELRLYLRPQEKYSFESRVFRREQPVECAVKSEEEYISFLRLPKEAWWVAPFVCPFCGTLCRGVWGTCDHQIISRGMLRSEMAEEFPKLEGILDNMYHMKGNSNFVNIELDGIRIKHPRVTFGREWFRFACIYARDKDAIRALEKVVIRQEFLSKRQG